MTPAAAGAPARIVLAENALVRARPDAAGAPIGYALRGEALPAAGGPGAGGWLPVIYRDRIGWVARRRAAVPAGEPASPPNSFSSCAPGRHGL